MALSEYACLQCYTGSVMDKNNDTINEIRYRRRRKVVLYVLLTAVLAAITGVIIYKNQDSGMNVLQPTKSIPDTVEVADGYVANNNPLSPSDVDSPALAKLNPKLLQAIQAAARDAEADGVKMFITAGWRSTSYQQKLLDEAVKTYGSLGEARRFVSTPQQSKHVSGNAVDVGPTDANSWLSQYGSDYGLCQTYANEMWHFELVIEPGGICPQQKNDASSP